MNQAPDERWRSCCCCRSGKAAERPGKLLSCWHRLRKHPHFNFPCINSGRYWYERGAEWRREGGAGGGGYIAVYSCNYPTLLVMIIILIREWNFVCPSASPTASFWKRWINKNFPLAAWVACDILSLSLSLSLSVSLSLSLSSTLFFPPSLSRWAAHSFTGEIASQRPTFRRVNIGKRCNQQNWGKALYFVHFNSPMTSYVNSDILPVRACACSSTRWLPDNQGRECRWVGQGNALHYLSKFHHCTLATRH